MEEMIRIGEQNIRVAFDEHAVHITNEESLQNLLEAGGAAAIETLVQTVKQQFRQLWKRELDISDDSLAVEIWGHVYCGHLAETLDNLVSLQLITKLTDKVIGYCAVIDCGESGNDNNRLFWDMLAPFKEKLIHRLPDAPEA